MLFSLALSNLRKPFLKNDTLSIDIGYTNTKLVHARKKKDKLKIIDFVIGETPGNCIKNGIISDLGGIAQNISKIMAERKINEKNVKIVISGGSNIISKLIYIPSSEQKAVELLIRDEVKRQMPVNIAEQRLFYRVTGQTERMGKICSKVLVTVVPNSIIENYTCLMKLLNFKPLSIEIPFSSVARFFSRGIEVADKNSRHYNKMFSGAVNGCTLVIDLGSETTNMSILNNGALEFNRIILTGGRNLDEVIATKLGIGLKEAEALKKLHGISGRVNTLSEEERAVDSCARYYLGEIFENVIRSIKFFGDRCKGIKPDRVVLIGGGSGLGRVREFAEEKIKLPVYTVDMINFNCIEFDNKLGMDKLRFLINALGISM